MIKLIFDSVGRKAAAELEQLLAQMQRANVQMQRDQKEIDELKAEARIIAEQTREVLSQLEAATA